MALPPGVRRVMRPTPRAVRSPQQKAAPRPLSLAAQCIGIGRDWPNLQCRFRGLSSGRRLVCRGALRPTLMSRTYMVRIEYVVGRSPRAYVESPALSGRADQTSIPHTYPADEHDVLRPCLYFPKDGDWRPDRLLSTTIVPWLLEWLVFYELWHVTGQWLGGGVDHALLKEDAATGETGPATIPVAITADPATSEPADDKESGGEPAADQLDLHLDQQHPADDAKQP